MATFGVVDLTQVEGPPERSDSEIDLDSLRSQLEEIRDAITPVLDEEQTSGGLGLNEIEVSLTLGAEGGIFFIAKGTAEASIKLTWARAATA